MSFSDSRRIFTEDKILKDVSLLLYNTFSVGGNAKYFFAPKTVDELKEVVSYAESKGIPYYILGNGSKVLISDKGYNGLIIYTGKLKKIQDVNNGVYCQSGVNLQALIDYASKRNLGGLEFLTGIPATLGGALVMNAGAYGDEIGNHVEYVEILTDGKIDKILNKDCAFSYRKSALSKKIIVGAKINLKYSEIIEKNCKYFRLKRQCSQPFGKSAGSVFKNPQGITAGSLIEKLSLKGMKIGGAYVSHKHANFIINDGTASAKNIYDLIKSVKNKVYNTFGVELKEEIIYLGEF